MTKYKTLENDQNHQGNEVQLPKQGLKVKVTQP